MKQPVRGLLALAALSIALAALGYRLWIRFPAGAGLLEDDSYFYAQIAYNLGTHGRSSFDGVTTTDGYHLLWAWLLAGVSALTSLVTADKDIHLGAMLAVYFFVVGATALRFARRWSGRLAMMLFAAFYSALSEGPLLAFLLLTFATEILLAEEPAPRAPLGYLAAALVPLARIDAAIIVAALVLALGLRGRRRVALATLGALTAGTLVHFVALWQITGHLVSVAARVKAVDLSHGVAGGLLRSLLGNLGKYTALTFIVLLVAAVVVVRSPDPRARAARPLLAALAAYLGGELLLNENVRSWYYIPALVVAAALLDRFFDDRRAGAADAAPTPSGFATWPARCLAVVVAALAAYRVWYLVTYAAEVRYAAEFVAALPGLVPADARLFVRDGAGYLGYFSGRSVINGDGLVNSHDYLDRLRAEALGGYLEENRIDYVVLDHYTRGAYVLRFHGLTLRARDATLLKAPPPGLRKLVAFGLYRRNR